MLKRSVLFFLGIGLFFLSACSFSIPTAQEKTTPTLTPASTTPPASTGKLTITVKRQTHGNNQIVTLDLESEYLPVVVASENDAAPYESLKVQATASRTFAMYKKEVEPRSQEYDVLDSEADQVYNPEKLSNLPQSKQQEIKQAVKDTEGMVLKYMGKIICGFFVSGFGGTENYVTEENEGQSGDGITQTTLGLVTSPPSKNPYNRGCMGQVQANDMASRGYTWEQILRHFYGSDIQIEPIDATLSTMPTPVTIPII